MMRLLSVMALLILISGCSPRLSPLYRDYEVTAGETHSETDAAIIPDDHAEVMVRIRAALEAAGWQVSEAVTPNVIAVASRKFREWGIYSIEVDLEVAPVGGNYVRLFVHPYRIYFTGSKRKIPYLRGSLARSVLKDLHEAFAEQGLEHIGTAQTRDRRALLGD